PAPREKPFEPPQVMVKLNSILELHLDISLPCHTLLQTHFPLHLAFPRLQCLQIKYDNERCATCGERYSYFCKGPECARGLVRTMLPHLSQLRMGHVETRRSTLDNVNRWELSQLK